MPTTEKTEVGNLADLSSRLFEAAEKPENWDVQGLISDAAPVVLRLSRMLHEARDLIEQVREASIIIRETASPVSIIAMDICKRLQDIEAQLMTWSDDWEPDNPREPRP